MDIFTVLDDRRQYAQDFAQPLAVEDINGLLNLFMITNQDTRVEYFRYVTIMDRVWMDDHIKKIQVANEKRKREAASKAKSGKR